MIPRNSRDILEFSKLLAVIARSAHAEPTRHTLLELSPLEDQSEILGRLALVLEVRRTIQGREPLPLTSFRDLSPLLRAAGPEGAVLDPADLAAFLPVMEMVWTISRRFSGSLDFPLLAGFVGGLTGHPEIIGTIRKSVDSEGNVLDTASAALSSLRVRIRRLEAAIRRQLEEMMRDKGVEPFLQDTFVTQRGGRWVIPVRMDAKGQVPGIVHDVSKSGETAFVEPMGILHLSNEFENLLAEEKAEQIRVLRSLSALVRGAADEIERDFRLLVELDVLNCIARFAESLGLENPQITASSGDVRLVRARHPLLALAYRNADAGRNVVPLDLHLAVGDTVMVITGANAGGKTIALKTIGLLVVMALSGIPIPADASSSIPVFRSLLVDIGDEQSIENNLSTFSAHISKIAGFFKQADPSTLILIDELGTGTDPEEGTALSCAILEELRNTGAIVFATTHLTGIKGFVHHAAGMVNAAMEFDTKTLTPLYRLVIGFPGESHAFDIARQYGLPEEVIMRAREMSGGLPRQFDSLIADLNRKAAEYEAALADLSKKREEMDGRERHLSEEIRAAEIRQQEILNHAREEALAIIRDARIRCHDRLKEIREFDRRAAREALKVLEREQAAIAAKLAETSAGELPDIRKMRSGDIVFVPSLGRSASVREVFPQTGRMRLTTGDMEIDVPVSDVRLRQETAAPALSRDMALPRQEVEVPVPSEIVLIGMRVEEALSRLEPFLNHAALAGLPEVRVIHGIGKGILARAVQEHLRGHPLVRNSRWGDASEGGRGATIVSMA